MVEKSQSGGVDAVEEEEEVVVVADVGGVWTVAAVETGRTKAKRERRPINEAAMRRRSTEVAFVHKNEFGVLEVIRPFAQRVHELEVAQVSTEITIDWAAEESVSPQKVGRIIWAPRGGQVVEVGERQ